MLIEEPRGRGVDLVGVSNLRKANGHLSRERTDSAVLTPSGLDQICRYQRRGRPNHSLPLSGQFVRLEGDPALRVTLRSPLQRRPSDGAAAAMGRSRDHPGYLTSTAVWSTGGRVRRTSSRGRSGGTRRRRMHAAQWDSGGRQVDAHAGLRVEVSGRNCVFAYGRYQDGAAAPYSALGARSARLSAPWRPPAPLNVTVGAPTSSARCRLSPASSRRWCPNWRKCWARLAAGDLDAADARRRLQRAAIRLIVHHRVLSTGGAGDR